VSLQLATTLAAMTCGRVGADPPTRAEYAAYVDGTGPREGML
jgi:hypothetical protein